MFQVIAYLAIALGMSAQSWYIYEMGYMTQVPDYTCTFHDPDNPVECNQKNICDKDSNVASWEPDMDSDKSLYNWQ